MSKIITLFAFITFVLFVAIVIYLCIKVSKGDDIDEHQDISKNVLQEQQNAEETSNTIVELININNKNKQNNVENEFLPKEKVKVRVAAANSEKPSDIKNKGLLEKDEVPKGKSKIMQAIKIFDFFDNDKLKKDEKGEVYASNVFLKSSLTDTTDSDDFKCDEEKYFCEAKRIMKFEKSDINTIESDFNNKLIEVTEVQKNEEFFTDNSKILINFLLKNYLI